MMKIRWTAEGARSITIRNNNYQKATISIYCIMKRSLMLTAIVAIATLLSMNAMAEPDPDFHIYLCFGQSNMEGQAAMV